MSLHAQVPTPATPTSPVESRDPQGIGVWFFDNLTQPAATVIASLGIIVAALITFAIGYLSRRQLDRHHKATHTLADTQALRDRFTTITTQLADPTPAIRTAAVSALEALADDWLERRKPRETQACINVLCDYLRTSYEPPTRNPHLRTQTRRTHRTKYDYTDATHEYPQDDLDTRHAITRTIAAHLQPDHDHSWSPFFYDLTGAYLHNANFTGATFSGGSISFQGATFDGETTLFQGSTFDGETASFQGATFSSKRIAFYDATFSSEFTSFQGATFSSEFTSFQSATFSGEHTTFQSATFSSKTASFFDATFNSERTSFESATFSSDYDSFEFATFSGKNILFQGATFTRGAASFQGATFSSSETTSFEGAMFRSVTTHFDSATFTGKSTLFQGAAFGSEFTSFFDATFNSERTSFMLATFSSSEGTSFEDATFSGRNTSFMLVTFSGDFTSFEGATFSGNSTSFEKPHVWANVCVDWDRYPDSVFGPLRPQPASIRPEQWPPTPIN